MKEDAKAAYQITAASWKWYKTHMNDSPPYDRNYWKGVNAELSALCWPYKDAAVGAMTYITAGFMEALAGVHGCTREDYMV